MKKFILGVVAGVALIIAVIAAGIYYAYEKGSAIQEEKEANAGQVRQSAVSQFGTTCENASVKIAAYVYNELKPGLSALLAEQQSKNAFYSSLTASIKKHSEYAAYCRPNARYPTGDLDFKTADKLVKLSTGLGDIHTYLHATRHANCDSDCNLFLVSKAIEALPKLEQVLVADEQYAN